VSSGEISTGSETGEFLDSSFEVFDLLLEFGCLCRVDSRKLIFEPLEARFFDLFVDIGFVDVLAFVDLVEIRLREAGDFECLVDFGGVDGGDTLAVDALVFKSFEDGLVVFEPSIASTGTLNRAILPMDGLVVVEAIKEKTRNGAGSCSYTCSTTDLDELSEVSRPLTPKWTVKTSTRSTSDLTATT
jgi:hypothetical protein